MALSNNDMKKQLYQNMLQLDLAAKYEEMLRVHCRHDYFNNKFLGGMTIMPTEQTKDDLKRHQLVYRQDAAGFSIGYAIKPNFTPVELIEKPVRLTFWMILTDNYFYNYTDIPYEPNISAIYHFTNRSESKLLLEEENYLSGSASVNGEDRVPIGPAVFNYEFEDMIFEETLVRVVDEIGVVYFERMVEEFAMEVVVNVMDAPPGKYFLEVGGEVKRVFYVYPSELRKLFGVIDIYIDKEDESPYGMFNNGKVMKKHYNLKFDSRKIYWKYLVIENAQPTIHAEHSIMDATRGRRRDAVSIAFTKPRMEELENGHKAVVIQTEEPIPLKEVHEEKFKLRTKKGKNKMEWLTDLPSPSAKSNFKTDEKSGEIFSEMVVFL